MTTLTMTTGTLATGALTTRDVTPDLSLLLTEGATDLPDAVVALLLRDTRIRPDGDGWVLPRTEIVDGPLGTLWRVEGPALEGHVVDIAVAADHSRAAWVVRAGGEMLDVGYWDRPVEVDMGRLHHLAGVALHEAGVMQELRDEAKRAVREEEELLLPAAD